MFSLLNIPISSFATCNINSLSLHDPGGLAGRKLSAINTIASLARGHDVLCVQDVRAGSDAFSSELRSSLPLHRIRFNSNSTTSGGVLTIIAPAFAEHNVTHKVIIANSILQTTITDPNNPNNHVTFINSYLAPTDQAAAWSDQVRTLHNSHIPSNSVFLGDLNHAPQGVDRSSDYIDRSSRARGLFADMLDTHHFSEVPQPMHTFYRFNSVTNKLSSSRIDHIFTNFSYTTLMKHHPDAHIHTSAPNTLCAYRKPCTWNSREEVSQELSLLDRQLVSVFPKGDGAAHITDHLPISVRLTDQRVGLSGSPARIPKAVYDHPDFERTLTTIWNASTRPKQPWARSRQLKQVIHQTAKKLKTTLNRISHAGDGNDELRLAIKVLYDAETLSHSHLCERYPDLPHLTEKADNGAADLLHYINSELAQRSFDTETGPPASKIAALAETLPNFRNKLTHLYDPSEEEKCDSPSRPTADTKKITNIIHNFWANKWTHKPITDPTSLFQAFNRRIKHAPTLITLESFVATINAVSNKDSCPGPDGIPFSVYGKILDIAAPILLGCLRDMQRSGTAPDDFNEGHLYVLPKTPTNRIEDTRPLVVNNTDNRIISTVINNSITPAVNSVVSNFQTGFRKDMFCSVEDNISFFNEKFYEAKDTGSVYDILFIDFKKAFDSVAHEAVFKMMSTLGFDTNYQNSIKALFHKAHCYTTADKHVPKRIDFDSGIKQGCPLSPTLFILVVEVLLDMIHNTTGSDVRFYADDAAIGDIDLIPKLPIIRRCLHAFGTRTGLYINTVKTVAITTGISSELRAGLDDIGWHEVLVVGKAKYLGLPIGFEATIHDVFEGPYQKFLGRYQVFIRLKNSYSLNKRVLIWNTWLLSMFNFVAKFYLIPQDYLELTDKACRTFIGSTIIKSLHLSRPTWLCGLVNPLRDLSKANLAALISLADVLPYMHDNVNWTMRIRSQRYQAVDIANSRYRVSIPGGTQASSAYRTIHHSPSSLHHYYPYLRERLASRGIRDGRFDTFLGNYKLIPYWLPDYCSFALLRLSHNMFPTDAKLSNVPSLCHLCNQEGSTDCISHIFHDCTVTSNVLNTLYHTLGWERTNVGHIGWLCADKPLTAISLALHCVLINSVWIAIGVKLPRVFRVTSLRGLFRTVSAGLTKSTTAFSLLTSPITLYLTDSNFPARDLVSANVASTPSHHPCKLLSILIFPVTPLAP
jgi:exonuclease III